MFYHRKGGSMHISSTTSWVHLVPLFQREGRQKLHIELEFCCQTELLVFHQIGSQQSTYLRQIFVSPSNLNISDFLLFIDVFFLLPGHQQTLPSNCDRSLPEWGQRGQQDGCYVNSNSSRALKNTSMDTRTELSNRPLYTLDCVT